MDISGGYVYMNGDIKLPVTTTVYANVPADPAMIAANLYGQSAPVATQIQPTHLVPQTSQTQQQQQPPHQPSLSIDQTAEYTTMNGAAMNETSAYNQEDMTGDAKGSVHNGQVNADGSTTSLEQLKQMLSTQLEYYFSRENLANDTYLLTQMDIDQYVPIWIVANFNQVKKLTKDINLITEVLRESPNVQVDDEGLRVRPNHKRCIIILREIPDNTPLEDVKNIFNSENCPNVKSCEFAHNNSWYITFESHEDAQKAFTYLREEVKEFQGKPIMARIKAKPIMNRLPIAPVTGALKNGYRVTPPPAVYDPTAVAYTAATPQRYLYPTNGAPISQGAVPYSGQVHMFPFQQQPFYPSIMTTTPWAAATAPSAAGPAAHGQNYYEISNVYAPNGIAPQVAGYNTSSGSGNTISKSQSGRYNSNYRNSSSHSTRGKQRGGNPNQQQGAVHEHRNSSLTGTAGGHILLPAPASVEHHSQQQHQMQSQSSNSNQSSNHRHYSSVKNNGSNIVGGHSQMSIGTMTGGSKLIDKSNAYGGSVSHHHVNSSLHHQSSSNVNSSGASGGHHVHQGHQQQGHYQGHSIQSSYAHQSEDDGSQAQHGNRNANSSKEQQWAQRFRRRRRDDGSDGGGSGGSYVSSSSRPTGGHSSNSIHLSSQHQPIQHSGNSGMAANGKNVSSHHTYSTSSTGRYEGSSTHHSSREHHHGGHGHHGYSSHREDRSNKQSGNPIASGNVGGTQHVGSSSNQSVGGTASPPQQPPQFDLEASAFPPLPGIEQTSITLSTTQHHSTLSNANFPSLQQSTNSNSNSNTYTHNTYASKSNSLSSAIGYISESAVSVSAAPTAPAVVSQIEPIECSETPMQLHPPQINQSLTNAPLAVNPTSSSSNSPATSNNWSENRLSDVVRGTTTKATNKHRRDSQKNYGSSSTDNSSPPPPQPQTQPATHYHHPHQSSTVDANLDVSASGVVSTSPTAKSPQPPQPYSPDTNTKSTKMLLTNKNTNVLNNNSNSPTVIKCLTHNNNSNKINNNIMADKATKTDESLINNGVDSLTISSSNLCSNNQDAAALPSSSSSTSTIVATAQIPVAAVAATPITCNVATMTTAPGEHAYHHHHHVKNNSFVKNTSSTITAAGTQKDSKNKFALNVATNINASSISSPPTSHNTSSTSINTGNVPTTTPVSPQTTQPTVVDQLPSNSTRLSYAQVAQHHKERPPTKDDVGTVAAPMPAAAAIIATVNVLPNANQITNLEKSALVEKDAKKKDAISSGTAINVSVTRVEASKDKETVREHRHNSTTASTNRNRDQSFKDKAPRERRDTGDSGSGAAGGNRRRN